MTDERYLELMGLVESVRTMTDVARVVAVLHREDGGDRDLLSLYDSLGQMEVGIRALAGLDA